MDDGVGQHSRIEPGRFAVDEDVDVLPNSQAVLDEAIGQPGPNPIELADDFSNRGAAGVEAAGESRK